MNIEFRYTDEFLREAKILSKRYQSFKDDLKKFCADYANNPSLGDDLGNGIRKIRMAIASKGKGKSNGARVITFTLYIDTQNSTVYLALIYDKSKQASVSKKDILDVLRSNFLID